MPAMERGTRDVPRPVGHRDSRVSASGRLVPDYSLSSGLSSPVLGLRPIELPSAVASWCAGVMNRRYGIQATPVLAAPDDVREIARAFDVAFTAGASAAT